MESAVNPGQFSPGGGGGGYTISTQNILDLLGILLSFLFGLYRPENKLRMKYCFEPVVALEILGRRAKESL
jgi:hypothetical protein